MKCIQNANSESTSHIPKRIFTTSLILSLIIFALTMSSPFFQMVKPVLAAGALTNIAVIPTNNIVNTRTAYDIFFKTATPGIIKSVEMSFPSGFDISVATFVIERGGIGSGSLSVQSPTTLVYTVTSPQSVSAGTSIRFEIGRITNSNIPGNFKVTITTKDTASVTIDGPTLSPSFPIKSITSNDVQDDSISGNDVSSGFMIRKTLKDDTAGHSHGWDPTGSQTDFVIIDSDAAVSPSTSDSVFISVMTRENFQGICMVADTQSTHFEIRCTGGPNEGSELHYVITKLPSHVISSAASIDPFVSLEGH